MHKTLSDVRGRGHKCDRVRVLQLCYFQSNSTRLLQIELRDNELQDVAVRWSAGPLRERESSLNLTGCILQLPGVSAMLR